MGGPPFENCPRTALPDPKPLVALVALVAPRVLRGFDWLWGGCGWLRGGCGWLRVVAGVGCPRTAPRGPRAQSPWLHWLHPVFCEVLPGCRGGCGVVAGWLHWLHLVFCRGFPGCRVFLLGFWGGCTKKAVKHEGKHTVQPAQPVQPGVLGQIPGQETPPDQKLAEVGERGGGGCRRLRGWLHQKGRKTR